MNLETVDASLSAGIFDNKKFQPDNIVRLLLTVIGHDPSTQRAETFSSAVSIYGPHTSTMLPRPHVQSFAMAWPQ